MPGLEVSVPACRLARSPGASTGPRPAPRARGCMAGPELPALAPAVESLGRGLWF